MNRAVDSLTLRLPLGLCSGVDASLFGTMATIAVDTAEILDERPTTLIRHDTDCGIKSKFYIKSLFGDEKYLFCIINSKMLKEYYLEGITIHNIRTVYDYLMSLNRFHIGYEDFLQSGFHDCDIKTDYLCNENDWRNDIYARTSQIKEAKLFKHRTTVGCQYGDQRKGRTNTKPFVKYYSKFAELTTNKTSIPFYEKYLSNYTNSDLRRTEVTVKNTDNWNYLKKNDVIPIYVETLHDLLLLTQKNYLDIIVFQVMLWESQHVKIKRLRKRVEGLSATNLIMLELYINYKDNKGSLQGLLRVLDKHYSGNQLTAYKSRYTKLFEKLVESMPKTKEIKFVDFSGLRDLF